MISVIVPAQNEASVISRGLHAMVEGAQPGEMEIIVACNGCSDRTAEIARAFGDRVRVIEIEQASKIAALNAADEIASGFPRFYVDADVVLDLASIRKMTNVLKQGEYHFATPELQMDLSQSSWPVRVFYRVWTELPYNRTGGRVGTGVYALSREGRFRFDRFPDVINDDGFVRMSFSADQRTTVVDAVSHVDPPRTLTCLIKAKTRVRIGVSQLRHLYQKGEVSDHALVRPLWRWASVRSHLWPSLVVYMGINLVVRRRAAGQRRAVVPKWERDDSRPTFLEERFR